MRTILFSLMLLISFPVFSQNYRTVLIDKKIYFDNGGLDVNSYRAIKPVTIYANSGDTIVKHRFSYEEKNFEYGTMAIDTGFMGIKTILRNDGMDIFLNRDLDSLFIDTRANLNDNWIFYEFPNNDYYEAKVTSVATQNILGVVDSVKTIELFAKDSLGNSLPLLYDGFELTISKSMGIVQALNFQHFPNHNTSFPMTPINIKGLPHLNLGARNITAADAFNFDIGDEIHYQFNNYSIKFQSIKINNKWYNTNQDSVYYEMLYREIKSDYTYGFVGDTVIGYYIGTSNLDSLALTVDTITNWGGILYTLAEGYNTYVKGVSVNGIIFAGNNTFVLSLSPGGGITGYVDGLGMTHQTYWTGYSKWIYYYNKSGVEFGQYLDFDIIDNTIPINKNLLSINVFPNPATDILYFQLEKPINNAEIHIYSILGELVGQTISPSPTNKIEFNVSEWQSGLYFYGLFVAGEMIKSGQVLIDN